jgi:autophagy-related protein 18
MSGILNLTLVLCPFLLPFCFFSPFFLVMGWQIDAHQSPLAAMAFSSKGMYFATASEKGTIVRVHLVAHATKVTQHCKSSFKIFSIHLAPFNLLYFNSHIVSSVEHTHQQSIHSHLVHQQSILSHLVHLMIYPMFLAATSSSGSLHMFFLGAVRNGRLCFLFCQMYFWTIIYKHNLMWRYPFFRSQSNKLLSSVIPGSETDALDPATHRVIHSVVPAKIKRLIQALLPVPPFLWTSF